MTDQALAGRTGLVGGVAGGLAVAASALAALAAVTASLDGDLDVVPFFVALTFGGGLIAALLQPPATATRRTVARVLAFAWAGAAIWAGALLVWYQMACGCSIPPGPPDPTYIGLPGTAFRLAATFGGGALVTVAAFGSPSRAGPPPG